jgi:tRNA(Ile)-lysidine synthase
VHFNHRTRGKESDRDENFVRDFAEKLGVRCVIGKAERVLKSENEMREERYRFLVETARNLGANKLATAHTLDDQFETFILNLIRGKGFFSVIGIAPHTKILGFPVVRPLLSTQKRHILDFLKKRNINYVEDSSNYDLSYLRNKIRAFFELLPDEIYNSILKGFFRFWLSSYQVVEFLGKLYDESPEKLPELIKTQIQLFREKGDYSFEEIKTLIKRK